MDAVGFSESAPPLYYALAWALDPGDRDGRVRAALALGRGRGGDDPGRLPGRHRADSPADGPISGRSSRNRPIGRGCRGGAGRGQPDAALVLAGGPCLRLAGSALRGLAALLRAGAAERGPARHRPLGGRLRPGARHSLLRGLRRRRRGGLAAAPPPPRERAGARHRRPLRPGAGAAGDPPDVLRPRRMDRQLLARTPALGNRRDLRQRRDQRHHRPPGATGSGPAAAGARAGGAGPARHPRCPRGAPRRGGPVRAWR